MKGTDESQLIRCFNQLLLTEGVCNFPIFVSDQLSDTQEAPKSLSLESSSSLESLASLEENDPPPRPLPLPQPRSGGAFASYVRRRGEPDGRTACSAETNPATKVCHSCFTNQRCNE